MKYHFKFILIIVLIFVFSLDIFCHHFILIHGAWHGGWVWFEVENLLKELGEEVTVVQLPGHNSQAINPGGVTLLDYQTKVTNYLDILTEPVVLVGHSMGGIVLSSVAESRPDKIDKLIYLAAFLLKDGQSLLDIADLDSNSKVVPSLFIDETRGVSVVDVNNRNEMFYHLSPVRYQTLSRNLIVSNPLLPFITSLSLSDSNYGRVRRFYIETLYDHAITFPIQELMIKESPCEKVYQIHSDHSPFFSSPKQLVNILLEIANDDVSNIVDNSEFDNNKTNWQLRVNNDSSADAGFAINTMSQLSGGNSAQIIINNGGGQISDVQFTQAVDQIIQGKSYDISFQARTNNLSNKTIEIQIKEKSDDFTVYWEKQDIIIKETPATFGPYEFICNESDNDLMFTFNLGNDENTTLFIDNIIINPN